MVSYVRTLLSEGRCPRGTPSPRGRELGEPEHQKEQEKIAGIVAVVSAFYKEHLYVHEVLHMAVEKRDIFEELKKLVQCEYISDLRVEPYVMVAKRIMAELDLSYDTLETIENMAEYLFDQPPCFSDHEQAEAFFDTLKSTTKI